MNYKYEDEFFDDGMVLMDGKLYSPETIQEMKEKIFHHKDGKNAHTMIRRYSNCYPFPDSTTPSFQEFKALGGSGRRKGKKI